MPNHDEQHEPADDGDRADEAELVGDHGEDEVAVGQRQVAELAVAAADAGAGQAAVGDAEKPWYVWYARWSLWPVMSRNAVKRW